MTKLEWCRMYAPTAYEDLCDAELLSVMSKVYIQSAEFDISSLTFINNVSDGARTKIWYKDDDGSKYLYKTNKINSYGEYTYENLSEYLAMRIGKQLKIPMVDIVFKDHYVLSKVMTDVELKTFLELSDEFSHSFHLSNLQTFNISTLLNEDTNPYCKEVIQMLLFDALIGNSDRHPGNFMYSVSGGFYPLFDNGSSLGCYIRDCEIANIMRDSNRFKAICTTKSKPVLRDVQKLTHEQLVGILRERHFSDFEDFKKRLSGLELDSLFRGIEVNPERVSFIKEFIKYRIRWFEV